MEENNTTTAAVDYDDWSDIDLSDAEVMDDAPETTENPEADQQTEETEAAAAEDFTLKYMGEEKSFGREDVITLAQKGMDYDRVKEKLETANKSLTEYETTKTALAEKTAQLEWLSEIAKEQGLSLDELLETTQATMMSKKTGRSIDDCKRELSLNRREKALEAREHKGEETKESARQADIDAFVKAHPGMKPEEIPKEVWEAVNNGETLVNAYQAWEFQQLKNQLAEKDKEIEKIKQKKLNETRSTGSQTTTGGSKDSAFDALWYDGN